VKRFYPALAFTLAVAASALRAGDDLARFSQVAIKPATAFIYVGTVTMTIPPFVRHNDVYSSTYTAWVFPYFYSEKGRIWITVPDDALRRVANGQSVDFTGRAVSEDGEARKILGHASPGGTMGGNIQVRVFVTRRISITYDTTYELMGPGAPAPPVTPR
jgi:hypothetical protein